MSNQFEQQLADRFVDHFRTTPARAGQVLRATFRHRETAETFAETLVNDDTVEWRSFNTGKEIRELPVLDLASGVPIYLVRVVQEERASDDLADHVVTQSGATTMRDLVTDSVGTPDECAVVTIFEESVSLDTLSAMDNLLEGPLGLSEFRRDLLTPTSDHDENATAVLDGLRSVVETELSNSEDTETLERLSKIRNAVDGNAFDELPRLVGELPGFIMEDYLTTDRLDEYDVSTITDILRRNRDHRDRIHKARRPGRQFQAELSGNYKQEFIEEVQGMDLEAITHTAAESGKLNIQKREFAELDIEAATVDHYGVPTTPFSEGKSRQAVLAVAEGDDVRIRARFRGDMSDVPRCLEYPDGSKDESAISKRQETLTAAIEPPDSGEIRFVNFQVFVGNKTTRGAPSHEFSIAVVPQELYEILSPLQLDVNVPDEAFVSHGNGALTLEGPTTTPESEVEVTDGDSAELVGILTLLPQIPNQLSDITVTIQADTANFDIQFQTGVSTADRESIAFPLILAAIAEPDEWASNDLELPDSLSTNLNLGEIQLGSTGGVGVEEDALPLLELEQRYVETASAVRRESKKDSLEFGDSAGETLPDELEEAYAALFEHFDEENTLPSTDNWGKETRARVESVLEAYQAATEGGSGSFSPFESVLGAGRIESATTEKVWLTPFHPIMLAYGLRLARWRDELVADDRTDGFRSEQTTAYLNPVGYLPYLYNADGEEALLRGTRREENALWATYSPTEDAGTETPDFVDRVVSSQGFAFMNAFQILFDLHPSRELVINTINMGDLGPMIEGIFQLYGRLKGRNRDYPEILVQIYGASTEGESLQHFLMEDAESSLRDRLQRYDDERVEAMRSNIKYVYEGDYEAGTLSRAHLTFFQGILGSNAGNHEIGEMYDAQYLDGLLPREAITVEGEGIDTSYTTGFGCDANATDVVTATAQAANALEAGKQSNNAPECRSPKRSIEATERGIQLIWDASQWAIHVRPGVGLDFYTRSGRTDDEEAKTTMIQHSDQYDSSSPGYDVVTSTQQRRPYVESLTRILDRQGIASLIDPEMALKYLAAVDGGLVGKIQREDDTTAPEVLGIAGAIAMGKLYLNRAHPDCTWYPTSIGELVGHDLATGGLGGSPISYNADGEACDDLCFIGLPDDPNADDIRLWLTEAKGTLEGNNQADKGVRQIENGLEQLKSNFNPPENPADDQLVRAIFGNFVITTIDRLHSYDVLAADTTAAEQWRSRLLNGDYDVTFVEGSGGTIGDVIVIGADPPSAVEYDGRVRILKLPATTVQLLGDIESFNNVDAAEERLAEAIPDLDPDDLE